MKKILANTIAFTLALTTVLQPVLAAEEIMTMSEEPIVSSEMYTEYEKASEPTTKELEKMIKLVKPKLDVPEECTEFDWNYNAPTYYNKGNWRMTWYDKDYSKEVYAVCDQNGNITSFSYYDYSKERKMQLPEYSKASLEKTAADFLAKLCPDASGMKLKSSYASSLYSSSYMYEFVRYENDIIVPDNTALVQINYITGIPTSMSISYDYTTKFADTAEIDAETAKKTMTENQKMKLSYRLKTEYDDDGKLTSRKAYLVYTPELSYLAVDAKTGKVYTERNTWSIRETGGSAGGTLNGTIFGDMITEDSAESEEARKEYQLSEEELAQLEVLENLITKQEAIDKVLKNDKLYIDPAATAVEAQLSKKSGFTPYLTKADENEKDLYQWNISFSAPYTESVKENGYFSAYMHAVVDAQDGKIISFRANLPGYNYYINDYRTISLPELKYTREQSEKIFTDFASEIIPEIMKNTRISDIGDTVVFNYEKNTAGEPEIPVYRAATVNCVRVNEGIDFTFNNVYGAVDRVTGKVTSFSYNWYDDVEFESPKNAITPEEACKALINSDGFGLNYEINSNYTYNKYLADTAEGTVDISKLYETEIYSRLVYSGYNYESTTVSALTGKLLNYNGDPLTEAFDYNYTDISGHWAENTIKTLSDIGFCFDETGLFKPDSEITTDEYKNLIGFFHKYASTMEEKKPDGKAPLTRTEAVKYIIDAAGYYKIAEMPDIFITDFADNSELKREDVGFIAIARGMRLVQGSANSFRPYDNITKAEAVTLIFNFVEKSN